MVATTPRSKPHIPWYVRWELAAVIPTALLAGIMLWSVVQSVRSWNWADGLEVLFSVSLPGLMIGIIFARLAWLPRWLAHILSVALGIAWAVQQIGPLLTRQVAYELNPRLAERLVTWSDYATEILIRTLIWLRILQAGGRGEDMILFVVTLALLFWALGYMTGWLLMRSGWAWAAVILNATVILINYTFIAPKPTTLFFLFLGSSLLLIAHQNIIQQQRIWRSAMIEYPPFLSWRFLIAAALFCGMVVFVTSLLPSNVSSARVARVWKVVSSPFTAVREGWEEAFGLINAPPGTGGGGFAVRSVQVGGARQLGNEIVMRIRSSKYEYWRAVAFDKYTGRGWLNTVGERARALLNVTTTEQARTEVQPGQPVPQLELNGYKLVTQTVQLAQSSSDGTIVVGGQLSSASLPILVQHGFLLSDKGQLLPNFIETSSIVSIEPLQQTASYTVSGFISVADEQSLRKAGNDYPGWITNHYLQLPDGVTERTKAKAEEIVQQAGATNPYDQAKAIEAYLRRLAYDQSRPQPPEGVDWVDFFLFEQQRGYCDDFATSMVVLLRSLQIPARWAQGYAGGTLDPVSNAYVVRQSVAHSWPEVYFPGFGWQRFEPTPASYANIPSRPTDPAASDQLPDTNTLGGFAPLNPRDELLLLEERFNSQFDLEALKRAEEERLTRERNRQLLIIVGVLVALLGGAWLVLFVLRRDLKGLSPEVATYLRLGRMASLAGYHQSTHTTPYEYAQELRQALPEAQEPIDRIVSAFVTARYHPGAVTDVDHLHQDLQLLRRPLLKRMLMRLVGSTRPRRVQRH